MEQDGSGILESWWYTPGEIIEFCWAVLSSYYVLLIIRRQNDENGKQVLYEAAGGVPEILDRSKK